MFLTQKELIIFSNKILITTSIDTITDSLKKSKLNRLDLSP